MQSADLIERAVDQLVDETCLRLHQLTQLMGRESTAAWPQIAMRCAATQLIVSLTAAVPTARCAAATILRTLWQTDDPKQVPTSWWTTPLGQLISRAVGTGSPDQAADSVAQPVGQLDVVSRST